jgi:hypothetical protein
MAQQPQVISIHLSPSEPPVTPTFATICIMNRQGQAVFFDFGYLDPLVLATSGTNAARTGSSLPAAHVARIVMTEEGARQLRGVLDRILGEADGQQ